jgi:hypothetical protein
VRKRVHARTTLEEGEGEKEKEARTTVGARAGTDVCQQNILGGIDRKQVAGLLLDEWSHRSGERMGRGIRWRGG